MRAILSILLFLLPLFAEAQADSSSWRLIATRTEDWSEEDEAWLPADSTAVGYNAADQRDVLERWQFLSDAWRLFRSTRFFYTTGGQESETQEVVFTPEGEIQELQRVVFSYNARGQLTLVQRQFDDNGQWVTRVRVTYFYGSDGQLMVRNREVIDNGGIIDLERNEYEYNAQGQRTEERWRVLQGDSLVNDRRNRLTYDAEGRLDSLQEDNWTGTSWSRGGLSTYQYFRSDTLSVDTAVLSQWLNGEWRPLLRTLERVNPKEPRSFSDEFQQFGGPQQWFSFQRTVSTYDPDLRIQIRQSQQRVNAWENSSRSTLHYDENDLLYLSTEAFWNDNQWQNEERTFRFYERYSPVTATTLLPLPGLKVFPNPATDWIKVELSAGEATFTRVWLYDLQGRLHLTQMLGVEGGLISLPSTLPVGTYVLRLQRGREQGSRLILRQ